MHRVIVVGSPRAQGRSAALADELFQACIEECPDDGVSIVSVASVDVAPCVGCDACRAVTQPPELPEDDDPLAPCAAIGASTARSHSCIIADDMEEVRKHLDAADELIVVSPVYFASVPSQLKALMDRLQPYFWSDARDQPKRPCTLHVVGEGGDPHGFEPLVGTVRSAFGVAGFRLDRVLDWVGKMSPEGEILADADVVLDLAEGEGKARAAELAATAGGKAGAGQGERPRLDLGAAGPERRAAKGAVRASQGAPKGSASKKGGKAPKRRG